MGSTQIVNLAAPSNDALSTILLGGLGAAIIGLAAAVIAAFITHTTKVSEFRQAWIDGLRSDIAAYIGLARSWIRVWKGVQEAESQVEKERLDETKAFPISNEARVLLWRIHLRINPRENRFKQEDDILLQMLDDLIDPAKFAPDDTDRIEKSWEELADKAVLKSQDVLKREWEVAKHPIHAALSKYLGARRKS